MHGIKNKYVLIIILPTKEKVKIFEQLNKGFKKYIDWNEHQTKISEQAKPLFETFDWFKFSNI